MPKELFDQPLIESPFVPDDSDQIAFGKPGVSGGKNILWSYLKQVLQGALEFLDLIPQNPAPTEEEGRFYYDDVTKAFSGFTHIAGVPPYRFGRVLRSQGINNTLSIIEKGSVCKIVGLSGTTPEVEKSQANVLNDVQTTIGMALSDIAASGGDGLLAVFDALQGVDTSGMNVNDLVYLSCDVAGEFVNVRPLAPDYALPIGFVSVVDAVNGVIGVRFGGFDGSDTSVNIEGGLNGIITQTPQVDFSVSVGIIYADITNEAYSSKNLPFIIDGMRYLLDTTTNTGAGGAARVIIPPGADSETLQSSIIYAYLNVGVPDIGVATSDPSFAHAVISRQAAFNDVRTLADGEKPLKYRRFDNAVDQIGGTDAGGKGLIEDTVESIRDKLGSNWITGQDATTTVNDTTIRIALTAGIGRQFRRANLSLFDGLEYLIYNNTSNLVTYADSINLTDITSTALGSTLLSNNTFYTIRIFYQLNSNGIGNNVIATRPLGKYSTLAEAIQDPLNYIVNINDQNIEENVYPLYDMVISRTGAGGTVITLGLLKDLRTRLAGGVGGGGASGGGGTDDKVRVTAADTTNDYLDPKISVSGGLSKSTVNPGANEVLDLNLPTTLTGDRVFTGQAHGGDFIETFSASKTFDAVNGNNQEMLVTATTTIAITNELPGTYIFSLEIDSVLDPVITIGASFGNPVDNNADKLTADNAINIITLVVRPNLSKYYSINTITI